jgi:hypothetical protein
MFSGDLPGAEDHHARGHAHDLRPAGQHLAGGRLQAAQPLEAIDPAFGLGGDGHVGVSRDCFHIASIPGVRSLKPSFLRRHRVRTLAAPAMAAHRPGRLDNRAFPAILRRREKTRTGSLFMTTRYAAFGAALLATTALTAGAVSAETLRWARAAEALTLDPHSQNEGPTTTLMHQIYEPLIIRNMEGQMEAGAGHVLGAVGGRSRTSGSSPCAKA